MKKLLVLLPFLVFGCAAPRGDEITYTRNNQDMRLKLTHVNGGGQSCSVEIRTMDDAKKYKERLQRMVKEIENFETELSIREKAN